MLHLAQVFAHGAILSCGDKTSLYGGKTPSGCAATRPRCMAARPHRPIVRHETPALGSSSCVAPCGGKNPSWGCLSRSCTGEGLHAVFALLCLLARATPVNTVVRGHAGQKYELIMNNLWVHVSGNNDLPHRIQALGPAWHHPYIARDRPKTVSFLVQHPFCRPSIQHPLCSVLCPAHCASSLVQHPWREQSVCIDG